MYVCMYVVDGFLVGGSLLNISVVAGNNFIVDDTSRIDDIAIFVLGVFEDIIISVFFVVKIKDVTIDVLACTLVNTVLSIRVVCIIREIIFDELSIALD